MPNRGDAIPTSQGALASLRAESLYPDLFENPEEHRWADERILRQGALLQAINDLLLETLRCPSEEEVARACLRTAEFLTGSRFGFIGEVNPAGQFDIIALSDPGWDACRVPKTNAVVMIRNMTIRGLWAQAIMEEKSQIINDPASHPGRAGLPKGHPPIDRLLGVPLKDSGKTIGVIALANKARDYTDDDRRDIEGLSVAFVEALKRKRAEDALRQSEERFRTLAEFATSFGYWRGPDGAIRYASPVCETMTGYKPEEFVADPGLLDRLIHPDDRRFWDNHTHAILPSGARRPLELRIVTKQGDICWVSHLCRPVYDEKGEYLGLRGSNRDITERKEAEEALSEQAHELARSNADLEQFAYVASHDLQEPLRMVSSYVQLLARRYKGKLDADADEFIAHAVDGAARMQALIRDLLEFSRVGVRGRPFAPVDCEQVLTQIQRDLKLAIDETGATVTHDPMPVVSGDQRQLTQVFQNLLHNALKFRGPQAPLIHVSARQTGRRWLFSVKDNGIGIEPEYAERIFAIFQRLHTRAQYPGTGIGLAICKKIVELHSGRIWVESQPGQGAAFYFTIPAKEGT